MDRGYHEVESTLTRAIGLDPAAVGSQFIRRVIATRIRAKGLEDREAYAEFLRGSSEELQALVEEIVVPESWFFRDDRPYALLQEFALEREQRDPGLPPLRILSAPCAAGEEPYSIAVSLLEAGMPPGRFRIDAVDISIRALERARQGLYGRNAFRGHAATHHARYFQEQPGGALAIDPAVSRSVRFVRGNMLDPDLLKNEHPYEVIFCRNLLIYLVDDARRQVVSAIDRLLAPSGLLFVGHAEVLTQWAPAFTPVNDPGSFAYRRVPSGQPISRPHLRPALPDSEGAPRKPRRAKSTGSRENQRAVIAHAGTDIGTDRVAPHAPISSNETVSPALEEASRLANARRYEEAAQLCEQSIRDKAPTAEAFFLLAMIRQAAGDSRSAEDCLQRVVYLDSQHDEALLALALIAAGRGDPAAAAGYRRRAQRALKRKGAR
jgi:chemotaxis protein methyltransferase WspC